MCYCLYRPPLIASLRTSTKKNIRGFLSDAYNSKKQITPLELILCDKRMDMLQWVRYYFSLHSHGVNLKVLYNVYYKNNYTHTWISRENLNLRHII